MGIIELVISMVFVYLLLSLMVTIVNEIVITRLQLRGKVLKDAIANLLNDHDGNGLAKQFYEHPLIKTLSEKRSRLPSYISAETFSTVVLDLLKRQEVTDKENHKESSPRENALAVVAQLAGSNEDTKKLLETLVNSAGDTVEDITEKVQWWFNEAMDRTTGWYKRKNQKIVFVIGLILAVFFNADSIHIFNKLNKDKEAATQLADMATAYVNDEANQEFLKEHQARLDSLLQDTPDSTSASDSLSASKPELEIDSLDSVRYERLVVLEDKLDETVTQFGEVSEILHLGWEGFWDRAPSWDARSWWLPNLFWWLVWALKVIAGWFITGIAVSLGAPFWFDLLKKLVNLRGSGAIKKAEKKK